MTDDSAVQSATEPGEPRPSLPPFLYLPCESPRPENGHLTVDLRRTHDGQVALLAYTALDRLVDACGQHQPWAVVPAERLTDVDRVTPFDLVLLDVVLPESDRRTAVAS